jgi:hypothetical protein
MGMIFRTVFIRAGNPPYIVGGLELDIIYNGEPLNVFMVGGTPTIASTLLLDYSYNGEPLSVWRV